MNLEAPILRSKSEGRASSPSRHSNSLRSPGVSPRQPVPASQPLLCASLSGFLNVREAQIKAAASAKANVRIDPEDPTSQRNPLK